MADAKITALTELTSADGADLLAVVDDVAGTPTTKKITLTNIAAWLAALTQTLTNKTLTSPIITGGMSWNGWIPTSALTRVSDTTATLVGDWTDRIQKGDKLWWLSNSASRWNYVVAISYSAGTGLTTITITSGYVSSANDSRFESGHSLTAPYISHGGGVGHPDVMSFDPTLTGFSANPTFTASFSIKGLMCQYRFTCSTNGTSNATGFDVSLPVTSGGLLWKVVSQVVDNNVVQVGIGYIATGTPTVVRLKATIAEANFTSSGNKSANFEIFYSI